MVISWSDAWNQVSQQFPNKWDRALFVEVVRGCRQHSCAYQCRARKLPVIIRGRTVIEAGRALLLTAPVKVRDTPVVLYGTGNTGLADWDNMRGDFDREWIEQCQITLPADTPRSRLVRITNEFAADIRLSVSTLLELQAALAVKDVIRGISVPGTKLVPLRDIVPAAIEGFHVVTVRSVSINREDYLTQEKFEEMFGVDAMLRIRCKFGLVVYAANFERSTMTAYVRPCMDDRSEYKVTIPYSPGQYLAPTDGSVVLAAMEKAKYCQDWKDEKRWQWIS